MAKEVDGWGAGSGGLFQSEGVAVVTGWTNQWQWYSVCRIWHSGGGGSGTEQEEGTWCKNNYAAALLSTNTQFWRTSERWSDYETKCGFHIMGATVDWAYSPNTWHIMINSSLMGYIAWVSEKDLRTTASKAQKGLNWSKAHTRKQTVLSTTHIIDADSKSRPDKQTTNDNWLE